MADYCTQDDIEKIFGERSVHRWADLDGDDDGYTIAARIAWASKLATEIVNARLQRCRYEVPFSTVPTLIVNLTAMQAGILLHDGRMMVSGDPDRVSHIRVQFHAMLNQILKGQLKLLNPSTAEELTVILEYQAPFAVTSSDDDDNETLVYEG